MICLMQAGRGVGNKLDLTSSGERWNGQWTVVYRRAISQIRLTELWLILGFCWTRMTSFVLQDEEWTWTQSAKVTSKHGVVVSDGWLKGKWRQKKFVKPIILYHGGLNWQDVKQIESCCNFFAQTGGGSSISAVASSFYLEFSEGLCWQNEARVWFSSALLMFPLILWAVKKLFVKA